jgi:hypothetical protein
MNTHRLEMHNVDYFSFDFNLIDCLNSLKAARLSDNCPNKNKERLTNALWRRSAQMANDIPKLNPVRLGWAKDMDDLTLFGPYSTTDEEVTEPTTFKSIGTKKSALKSAEQLQIKMVQEWKLEYSDSLSNSDCSMASTISRVSFNSVVEQRVIVTFDDVSKPSLNSSIVNFKPARLNDESWSNSSDSLVAANVMMDTQAMKTTVMTSLAKLKAKCGNMVRRFSISYC